MASPLSVKPYYSAKHSKMVKSLVDKLLASSKQKLAIKFSQFPQFKPATLRTLVFQGWEYLADKEGGIYKDSRNLFKIRTTKEALEFERRDVATTLVEVGESEEDWRGKLEQFLDSSSKPGEELELKVYLSEEDRQALEISMEPFKTMFKVEIEFDKIKVTRL